MAMAVELDKEIVEDNSTSEFCEKQVALFANEFSLSWKIFCNDNKDSHDATDKELIKIVQEALPGHLSLALSKNVTNGFKVKKESDLCAEKPSLVDDIVEVGGGSDEGPESPSTKVVHRTFFRRLSFRRLKKGKIFHKQHSDEVELSPHHGRSNGRTERHKSRIVKMSVECVREGAVHLLAGDTQEGQPHWLKCRMVLVKMAAGYTIEFYTPPKNTRPRTGVFCQSVVEVRETTDLELPDFRNTFVIKAESGSEWVVEGQDHPDMKSWLTTIIGCCSGCCEKERSKSVEIDQPMVELPVDKGELSHSVSVAEGVLVAPPDLPPRAADNGTSVESLQSSGIVARLNNLSRLSRSQNSGLGDSSAEEIGDGDIYARLPEYPWFHGTLSRCDGASAVLQESTSGHGVFLVRQSETRKGEYVLTFNYQGRAKHLRMTINPDGACRVQHLSFATIFDLLEYFRDNHIPLESGGNSDVTLTEFVVAPPGVEGSGGQGGGPDQVGSDSRRLLSPPDNRELSTHGGSVRLTIAALDRLTYEQSGSSGGSSGGRAVENMYTFT